MVNQYKDDNSQKRFKEFFGKPIEDYATFKKATALVRDETRKNYGWRLPSFFLYIKEDPDSVIVNRKNDLFGIDGDEERYDRLVKLYIQHLVSDKGYTGRGAGGICGVIQGFFRNNSKRLALDLGRMRLPKARRHKKFSPDVEVMRVLHGRADSARDKFIVSVSFQNGFAPVDCAALERDSYPREPWVYFEFSRSKTGEVTHAVSMPDVCDDLKAYMRIRGNDAGPLLLSREGALDNHGVSRVLSDLINAVPEFAGIKGFCAKSMRDGFKDALVATKVDSEIRKAFMGHVGDIEGEYGGQKQLEEALVAAAKQAYSFLCLNDANADLLFGRAGRLTEEQAEKLIRFSELLEQGKIIIFNKDDPNLKEKLKRSIDED